MSTELRHFLLHSPFAELTPKPEYTMFGRTYSIGYEADLDDTLVERPRRRITDPSIPWAIWYPLRRSGSFEQLSAEDQRKALMEHGGIGRAYGRAGLGTDIRLACHGLTKDDNDFVVALIGSELYPLSSIVQRMRKTVQTSATYGKDGTLLCGQGHLAERGQVEQYDTSIRIDAATETWPICRNRQRPSCAPVVAWRPTTRPSGSCARPAAIWPSTERCGPSTTCWR